MRGKVVNLCIAGMNILFGILIGIYTMYIPQELAELTVQETKVKETILKVIYFYILIVGAIDIYQYRNHRDNPKIQTGYLFGIFSLSFILIKFPIVTILPIISGLIIAINTLKDNVVDLDSTAAISVSIVLCVAIIITGVISVSYENMGQYIKNRENKNAQSYSSDFFKYITELDITDPFINVKKDGKYGYIIPSGKVVIDYKFDYASPFINVTLYNKDFQIALVCEDGMSKIIMKNQRLVMSYMSETSDEDYEAKMKELENIYKETLGQGGEMQTEVEASNSNIRKIKKYEELSDSYTYRYDYNDEYDIIVTESNLGLEDKFELAKKDNLDIRIDLDCDSLDYDGRYLYLYSNGTIPFYDLDAKEQGWFTSYGKKNTMTGKAQILDYWDDRILLRNYNDDTVYFVDTSGEKISETYKDICIASDGYIVKNDKDKYMVIDKEFNKMFEEEFDVIDSSIAEYGLYICTNLENKSVEFTDYNYAKLSWKILNSKGETLLDNLEQVYSKNYRISNDKDVAYVIRYQELYDSLKDAEYSFVGDKFYSAYLK